MQISFRQGIVQHQAASFLLVHGSLVDLVVVDTPFVVNLAHFTKDYLHVERLGVVNAWAITPSVDQWLFIDINTLTGVRTFGKTLLVPAVSATAPIAPSVGKHWFDTINKAMKVWSGTTWTVKVRVFVCKLVGGSVPASLSIDTPLFTNTQVGDTSDVLSGNILFDEDTGLVLRTSNGRFITTEDTLSTTTLQTSDLKVASLILEAEAQQVLAAFTIVKFLAFGKIVFADALTSQQQGHFGIIQFGAVVGDIVQVTVEGAVTNPLWDWTLAGVNAPLYSDATGQLVSLAPVPGAIPVATIVDKKTIVLGSPRLQQSTTTIINPLTPLATESIYGKVRLSLPASNPADPIAVGDNDPRLSGGGGSAPANEIVYGTGPSIDSDADFTYVSTTNGNDGQFFVNTQTGIGAQGSVQSTTPAKVAIYGVTWPGGAGTGGAVDIWGGYAVSSADAVGGPVNIWGGYVGGGPVGTGGTVNILGGTAGGTGGNVNITGGGGSNAGEVNITGGTSTTGGPAGNVVITGGTCTGQGDGGFVTITAGTGNPGNGQPVTITASNAANSGGGPKPGGAITLNTGDGGQGTSNIAGAGGNLVILLGDGAQNLQDLANNIAGAGGNINVTFGVGGYAENPTNGAGTADGGAAGSMTLTGAAGGGASLTDGSSSGNATGGVGTSITILSGNGGNSSITSGSGTSTAGDGGGIVLTAGGGGTATGGATQVDGDGGNVTITAGASGTGTNGIVTLTGGNGDFIQIGASIIASAGSFFRVNTNSVTRLEITSDGTVVLGGDTGTAGQVFTSNGPGTPATWQAGGGLTQTSGTFLPELNGTTHTFQPASRTGVWSKTGNMVHFSLAFQVALIGDAIPNEIINLPFGGPAAIDELQGAFVVTALNTATAVVSLDAVITGGTIYIVGRTSASVNYDNTSNILGDNTLITCNGFYRVA